jgi:hypothetical protein
MVSLRIAGGERAGRWKDADAPMPVSQWIMLALGLGFGALGLPVLLRGDGVRRLLGLRDAPETTYVLRIVGAMLSALGLILIVFALAYASAGGV